MPINDRPIWIVRMFFWVSSFKNRVIQYLFCYILCNLFRDEFPFVHLYMFDAWFVLGVVCCDIWCQFCCMIWCVFDVWFDVEIWCMFEWVHGIWCEIWMWFECGFDACLNACLNAWFECGFEGGIWMRFECDLMWELMCDSDMISFKMKTIVWRHCSRRCSEKK